MADQGQLVKAQLKYKAKFGLISGTIDCQFNPTEFTISKTNALKTDEIAPNFNSPKVTFSGGQAARYSLTLYFDTYHADPPVDVREHTNKLLALTLRDYGYSMYKIPKATPPSVTFVWGSISLFSALVESVDITYQMFAPDGTPLRAKAEVKFVQQRETFGDDLLPWQNPTSRTDPRRTRKVHSQMRLDQIAYEEYGNSSMWRRIAEANGIDNPFELIDGQILVIPQD